MLSLVSSTFFGRLAVVAEAVVAEAVVEDIIGEDVCGVAEVVHFKVACFGVGSVVVVSTSAVNVQERSETVNSLSLACGISVLAYGTEVLGMKVRSFTLRTDGDVMVGPDVGMTYVVFSWMRVVVYW